jgi:hypothetical protein
MKKAQAVALEPSQATLLPWALLLAEMAAAVLLFSSGRVPAILLRSLQLFLRF